MNSDKLTPEEIADRDRRRSIRQDGIRNTMSLFSQKKPCNHPSTSSPSACPEKTKTESSAWRFKPPQP